MWAEIAAEREMLRTFVKSQTLPAAAAVVNFRCLKTFKQQFTRRQCVFVSGLIISCNTWMAFSIFFLPQHLFVHIKIRLGAAWSEQDNLSERSCGSCYIWCAAPSLPVIRLCQNIINSCVNLLLLFAFLFFFVYTQTQSTQTCQRGKCSRMVSRWRLASVSICEIKCWELKMWYMTFLLFWLNRPLKLAVKQMGWQQSGHDAL